MNEPAPLHDLLADALDGWAAPARDRLCDAQLLRADPKRPDLDVLPTRPLLGRPLTQRQHQVISLVAEGMSNAQIGKQLLIAAGTVSELLSRAQAKLGARDRANAVHIAWQRGLLGPPHTNPDTTRQPT